MPQNLCNDFASKIINFVPKAHSATDPLNKLWNKHYKTALRTLEKSWLTTPWSAKFLSRIADTVKKFYGKGEPGAILTSY